MRRTEDYVLAILLTHLRRIPGDKVRAALATAAGEGISLGDLVARDKLLSPQDLHGFQEAARYLTAGDHLRACPNRHVQLVCPPAQAASCPTCRSPLIRGILPSPQAVQFDPGLERQVRRIILDTTARGATKDQVEQARRLNAEGKLARRPEKDLAPRERAPEQQKSGEGTLGNFQLLDLIGRGSSSYVYKAKDRRDGRVVALKVLYFQQGEAEAAIQEKLARFRREAELASKLEHPNLVPVLGLEQAGPWYCIPMQLVDGPTLAQLLEARTVSDAADPRHLAGALCEVARGLHYAHCQGVIHRDVNPRNILFSSSGQVYLGDFGISRPQESGEGLTRKGVVLGTIAYASLERLESEARADARSDVYSLGVVLYEILAGTLPFPETDTVSLIRRLMKGPPESARAAHPELPEALDRVALQALERDPARRYASALEFAEALSAALAGEEAAEAPGAAPARAERSGSARPVGFALVAVALVIGVLLGMLAGGGGGGGAGLPRDVADALAPVEPAWQAMMAADTTAKYGEARTAFEREVARAGERLGAAAPEAQFWRGRMAWSQGRAEEAEAAFARAAAGTAFRLEAQLLRGVALTWLAGRYGGPLATRTGAAAVEAFQAAAHTAPSSWEGRLAETMVNEASREEAETVKALAELARERPERPEPVLLSAYVQLRMGRRSEALAAVEPVVAKRPFHPALRAVVPLARLDRDAAADVLKLTEPLCSLWPDMVEPWLLAATARVLAGEHERALELLDRVDALDLRTLDAHRLRARALVERGRWHEAVPALSRAIELNPGDRRSLLQRGRLNLLLGDRGRGQADLKSYLARFPDAPDLDVVQQALREQEKAAPVAGPTGAAEAETTAWADTDGDSVEDTLSFDGGLYRRHARGTPGAALGLAAEVGLVRARGAARGPGSAQANPFLRIAREDAGREPPTSAPEECALPVPFEGEAAAGVADAAARGVVPGAAVSPEDAQQLREEYALPFPTEVLEESDADDPKQAKAKHEVLRVLPAGAESPGFAVQVPLGWPAKRCPVDVRDAGRRLLCALHVGSPESAFSAPVRLQVHMTRLTRETDVEEWLARFAELRGWRVVRGRTGLGRSGAVPDWLAVGGSGAARRVVRLTAIQDGALLYLVTGEAALADYAAAAAPIARAVLSWRTLDQGGLPQAEPREEWNSTDAVRLKVSYPKSWQRREAGALPPQVVGTVLEWQRNGEVVGRLTIRGVNRGRYGDRTAEEMRRLQWAEWEREGGVAFTRTLSRAAVRSELFPGPGELESLAGRRAGKAVEASVVVLQDEDSLVSVALMGPSRDADPAAYSINRRALEVVLLEMKK